MFQNNQEISFGTDGWRAIIAEGFTFENVRLASKGIAKYITKNQNNKFPVLIGYDPRFLACDFANACAEELVSLGLTTKIVTEIVPTPVIAFSAASQEEKTSGAIQFTASHNPPKYCGLKYITNYGGPAPLEVTDKITGYIKEIKKGEDEGYKSISIKTNKLLTFSPKEPYAAHIKKLVNLNIIKDSNLNIIYDPLYGAGNKYLDYILETAGCKISAIHNEIDPLFGGLLPEPREENLSDLKKTIIKTNANLGLATDGDADRLGAIDEKGTFYSPNKIASMILRHLVKNKKLKGTVVRTLSTTHLMDHLAKKYNLKLVETCVGFKWICDEMRKGNVLIGAEESGGLSILNHIPDKDAILAGVLVAEMMAFENKTLQEIYKDTLDDACWFCINDKLDIHINDRQKKSFISLLQSGEIKKYGNLNIESLNTIEGAKYTLKDGSWFMARASGTEPVARVYFEATSNETLEKMKDTVNKIVEAICQK